MNIFEKIAENRIQEAQERGDFDDLPCHGKPIDLCEYFQSPPHLRMAYSLLKNARVLPAEVQLKKEIETLRQAVAAAAEQEKPGLMRRLNEKITQLNITLEYYRGR